MLQFYHFLALRPAANYSAFLSLDFIMCTMGLIKYLQSRNRDADLENGGEDTGGCGGWDKLGD